MDRIICAVLFSVFFLAFLPALAQEKPVQEEQPELIEEKLYLSVFEIQPEFPGGHDAMIAFLNEHLIYPAKQETIAGTVILDFIVTKDGNIKEIRVLKSLVPSFDLAAIQAVKEMPSWIPAKSKEGEPVNVRIVLPVQFNLYQKH